ncbi:MAG: DUF2911 domain-containing protein [Bacteroidota bacterium]|jgi:hypothetical protein|nr:MAG: hypothetical protein DIU61_08650 [Bacteroidota bacterium]
MTKWVVTSVIWLCVVSVYAQESRLSPLAMARMRYKDTYVKITYGQPFKRGREIFGNLVPYGEVWRTGANEATEITLTGDLLVNGLLLRAGTYSIFTIPDRIKWTIIINRELNLWGSYNYNPKLDVFRFDAPVQESPEVVEAFTIALDQNNDRAEMTFQWDRVRVTVPIRFVESQ